MHFDSLDDFRGTATAHARYQYLAPAPARQAGGQKPHDLRNAAVDLGDEDLEDMGDADRGERRWILGPRGRIQDAGIDAPFIDRAG